MPERDDGGMINQGEYQSPILCRVYRIFAALALLGAVVSAIAATAGAISDGLSGAIPGLGALGLSVGSAIVLLGIGEVVDLIGRTAHHTGQTALELKEIARRSFGQAASSPGEKRSGSEEILAAIHVDLKGLRGQVDNIEAGPLAQLAWLAHIAQKPSP